MNETLTIFWLNAILFAVAAVLCYLLTQLFIRVSYWFDLLDYPTDRKKHAHPIPFLGGVSIFVSFWTVVFLGIWATYFFNHEIHRSETLRQILSQVLRLSPKLIGIFLGSLVILMVGLADDKFHWKPLEKLIGQMIAALILMKFGVTVNLIAEFGVLGYVITFVWILLIINAFNFIDSLDGHCAGIAIISCTMFFWLAQIIDQPMVGLFLISFAGILIGFFPNNFKPAKIFLGDNGSLLVGYMMAAFTLLCRYQSPRTSYVTFFIPVLMFGVPIYDTLSVIVARLSRGTPPWEGDRNHFAHRLVKIGMGDRAAVIFSYFVAFTIGHVAILTTQVSAFGEVLIAIIFVSIIGVIAFLEFYAAHRIRLMEQLAKKGNRRRTDIWQNKESGS